MTLCHPSRILTGLPSTLATCLLTRPKMIRNIIRMQTLFTFIFLVGINKHTNSIERYCISIVLIQYFCHKYVFPENRLRRTNERRWYWKLKRDSNRSRSQLNQSIDPNRWYDKWMGTSQWPNRTGWSVVNETILPGRQWRKPCQQTWQRETTSAE